MYMNSVLYIKYMTNSPKTRPSISTSEMCFHERDGVRKVKSYIIGVMT